MTVTRLRSHALARHAGEEIFELPFDPPVAGGAKVLTRLAIQFLDCGDAWTVEE